MASGTRKRLRDEVEAHRAVVVLVGAVLLGLLAVVALPERAWERVAGIDTLARDLGAFHMEGVQLRAEVPWEEDVAILHLPEWNERAKEWNRRVVTRLEGTPWLATYVSFASRERSEVVWYWEASRLRNELDERLERLGQIIAAIGGRS